MEQKKLLISLGEIIELTCELVDFLPVRELTVDHQDLDPALCFSKFPLIGVAILILFVLFPFRPFLPLVLLASYSFLQLVAA